MSAVDYYLQMPPVSRIVATSILVTSLAVHLGVVSGDYIIYYHPLVWTLPPQLWRLVTSFLVTTGGLGMLFDTYFIYRYLSVLEVGNPRFPKRDDLVWYLMVVSSFIVASHELIYRYTPLLSGPYVMFLKALESAICYTATQDQRGTTTTLWFFNVPTQSIPYCLIFMNFLQPGGTVYIPLQFLGIGTAHLWDFLTRLWPEFGSGSRQSLLPTPRFVSTLLQLVENAWARVPIPAAMGQQGPGGGRDDNSRSAPGAGPLPRSWEVRGAGRKLGGS